MLLSAPYHAQRVDGACGAAALEMICDYFQLAAPPQEMVFEKLQRPQLGRADATGIALGDLIATARSYGLWIDWLRLTSTDALDKNIAMSLIRRCIETEHCPTVVCQRYSSAWPRTAHYRIVVGIDRKRVFLHDPCPRTGSAFQPRRFDDFVEDWKSAEGSLVTEEAVVSRGAVKGFVLRERVDHFPCSTYVCN